VSIVFEKSKYEDFFDLRIESLSDINPLEIVKAINSVPLDKVAVMATYGEAIGYLKAPMLKINSSYSIYGVKLWSFIFQLSCQYDTVNIKPIAEQVLKYLENIYEIYYINKAYPYQSDEDGEFDIGVSMCRALFSSDNFLSRIDVDLKSRIFNVFGNIFKSWDLDHEHPATTDMLDVVLSFYSLNDFPKYRANYIDLLTHRLTQGQHRILEDFNYLEIARRFISIQNKAKNGIAIKDILDSVLSKENKDVYFIYQVCTPIYGNRKDLIQEIERYYNKKFKLTNNYPRLIGGLDKIGEVVSMYINEGLSCSPFNYIKEVDTGFHTLSMNGKKWISNNII